MLTTPEMLVIGGGIIKSKDVILPYIKKFVDIYARTPWNDVKTAEGSMSDNMAVYGVVYKCGTKKIIKDD